MVRFDLDKVFDMAAEFADKHKNSSLADDVEYLFEWLSGMRDAYTNGEVERVVNALGLSFDNEEEAEMKKSIRGIKSEDVAWIAAHFGFLYGMLYAANREKFQE